MSTARTVARSVRARLLMAGLLVVAVVTVGLATVLLRRLNAPEPAGVVQGQAQVGGPFTLTDQTGRRVTDQEFRGRLMLVYFGYTGCPDVCPLGLQTMTEALQALPAAAATGVAPVFITVDPARDTPAVLKAYLELFDQRIVGLSGTQEEVTAATRAYRLYVRKGDADATGAYLIDHSVFTYVLDREGRYVTHFGQSAAPEAMTAKLTELLAAS